MDKRHTLKPINILMLDDSPDDHELVRVIFEREKIANNLQQATTKEEAFESLSSGEPCLFFIDMRLGVERGLDVLEEAYEEGLMENAIPIALSSCGDIETMARADLLGIPIWVDKPLNTEKLLYVMQQFPTLKMAIMTPPEKAA